MRRAAVFLALALLAGFAAAQTVRPKARPLHALSPAQTADLARLVRGYEQTFGIVSRAGVCNHPDAMRRMAELLEEMIARHGSHGDAVWKAVGGGDSANAAAMPCELIPGAMANLALPEIPPSLLLGENEPLERIVWEHSTATGPYRWVSRTPADQGPPEQLIIHRGRIVFRTTHEMTVERQLEELTPVLLVRTVDKTRKCRNGEPRFDFHAISLPATGDSAVVALLGAECMIVYDFYEEWGRGLCAWMAHSGVDERRSKIYAVEDSGRVVPKGELGAGVCPK